MIKGILQCLTQKLSQFLKTSMLFKPFVKNSGLSTNPQICTATTVMFGDYITKNIWLANKLPTCGT